MSSGTGSTGVPTDRSTMPSGCAAAVFLYGSSLSQGKVGNRSETADTGSAHFLVRRSALVRPWAPARQTPRPRTAIKAMRPYGTEAARLCGPLLLVLRRQRGDEGVVALDQAQLAGAAGGAELVEELDVRLVVVLPLLRSVVLVEDRLDRADRLTGTAVDAFVRVDVQGPLALVDAVDRALLDARLVLDVDTRLRDDVGHAVVPPPCWRASSGSAASRAGARRRRCPPLVSPFLGMIRTGGVN